jgi:3-methyl-2-oxobutanoate hydroxymethyltransferase
MSASPATGPDRPVTTSTFLTLKAAGKRIAMVTAYDFAGGRLADEAGIDAVLVGDSLGMTVLGYDSTLPVTLDDMLRATAAVTRAVRHALVVADMPFLTFQVTPEEALVNAGRLMAEAGAGAVKLEGGMSVAPTVVRLTSAGIPVMGHVGLTPQSVNQLGGYRIQAKDADAASRLLDDCRALQAAGCFAIVLECIPAEVALMASAELEIPTIGIGAGVGCDGEVQVWHDVLGMGGDFTPRHARRYAELGDAIRNALSQYAADVRSGAFPGEEQTTHMPADTRCELESRRASAHNRTRG